ncbi:hypothetical protein CU098_004085 [Rhizopus stolonifer]|uniref:t-SNARE coiled-coil homology domain-containing protein n=1 Tax=Rhizopus stolonifer TaxID=4846 RepID=A0A367KKV8_RHIST|nr:hypothetical protein CU098_004085 [Rhizopus stolonifer]
MSFNDLEQGLPNGPIHIDTDNDDRLFKDLAQRIAQQTFHINGNTASIERLVNLLGTNRDSVEVRNNLHDVTLATRDLIKDSTLDLKSLSSINLNDPKSRQRRLEQQKLSKDFQKVVAHFQTIQKASASKQREFIDKTKATTVMLQNQVEEEEIEQQQQLNGQRQAQIEALDHEIEYNELLIHDRENEIQNIEQGIGELNEIFRDMGMLVNEQESGIRK